MKRQIDVVGAVVISDGQVLCVQRGPQGLLAGKWEFPGGKIEAGESPQQALKREIREELTCHVEVGAEVTTTSHEYDFGVVKLTTFYCRLISGAPQLLEHAQLSWQAPEELLELDWAPADIPTVGLIQSHIAANRRPPLGRSSADDAGHDPQHVRSKGATLPAATTSGVIHAGRRRARWSP